MVEKTSEFVRKRVLEMYHQLCHPTHHTYPQWNTKFMRFLKNLCIRRTAMTKSELIKVAKEVWSEIKIRKIRRELKLGLLVWI